MQRETGRDLGKISIGRPADPGRLSASQDSPLHPQMAVGALALALKQHVCPSIVIVLVLRRGNREQRAEGYGCQNITVRSQGVGKGFEVKGMK